MKRPEPYQVIYAADRRKHRHRCRCCRKIIQPGSRVLMWKAGKGTYAVHIGCASLVAVPASAWAPALTWLELAWLQSDEHARRLGHAVPEWRRAPHRDRRIARGDDFAGDAWINPRGEIRWTVVGRSPAEQSDGKKG